MGGCEGTRVIPSVPQDPHTPPLLDQYPAAVMFAKLGDLLSWEGRKRYRGRGSTSRAAVAQPFHSSQESEDNRCPNRLGHSDRE